MIFTGGRAGSWRLLDLCREMFLLDWMFMLLSLLALVFYLLFFAADIRLLHKKNRNLVKRFLELQESEKKKADENLQEQNREE